MDNLTDKILGIASDFGCDVEGFRPHLEQIVRELETKNPPSRNKVGDASNSIADKQLREAILNLKKPDKFLSLQPIEAELQDLIDLFHTYGNRERIDESHD